MSSSVSTWQLWPWTQGVILRMHPGAVMSALTWNLCFSPEVVDVEVDSSRRQESLIDSLSGECLAKEKKVPESTCIWNLVGIVCQGNLLLTLHIAPL